MYTLIDLHNENQAEYLNSALRRHGLDSFVFKNGVEADGKEIFSITCLNASELKQARYLIYSSQNFLADIQPEAALTIREIRHKNSKIFLGILTSKQVLAFSSLALVAALIGYIFDI
jgi:hypothetical protein